MSDEPTGRDDRDVVVALFGVAAALLAVALVLGCLVVYSATVHPSKHGVEDGLRNVGVVLLFVRRSSD